ncbi:MAG TPA: hypothetical protein GYA07_15265 [Verrucomicrobia bacterium]|nr:hypothetical protein [Verrucomicrobiota bacterium]
MNIQDSTLNIQRSRGLIDGMVQRLRNWREWELNPIVVKELRQAVRSWSVTGMLLLFLSVLFCTGLVMILGHALDVHANQRLGANVFQAFIVILTFSSLVFIPLYVGTRLAAERQENNLDLLYITTLTPHRIIRGKFFCGAYMAVLFFSACMPFMAFTNLLRGIDLPTVGFILVCLFLVVCAAVQCAIFIACLPVSKLFKILLGLGGFIVLNMVSGMLNAIFYTLMQSGIVSMSGGVAGVHASSTFWTGFATAAGVILAVVVLLYYMSVALISPPSANRAFALRVYITVVWLLSGILSLYRVSISSNSELILPWAITTFFLLSGALVVVISNNDELSVRVRRRIPSRAFLRILAFLFYNGAAGGLVWVALLLSLTAMVTMVVLDSRPSGWRELAAGAATVLYLFAYALTALLIHRKFFSRRPAKLAGILMVFLAGAWALLPNMVLFFLGRLTTHSFDTLQPGSIFNVWLARGFDSVLLHLNCGAAWLLLMLVLNARWFLRQLNHFQPVEAGAPAAQPPPAPAPPPPLPTVAAE